MPSDQPESADRDGPRYEHLLHLGAAGTEARSEATKDIDRMSINDGLALLAEEFQRPFEVFREHASDLAPVVEAVVRCVRDGNTVHLFGAGTSGRMAALDAAEIPPTFGLPATAFRAHLAGGPTALTMAVEDAEDSGTDGTREGRQLNRGDVALGVTASGRTPYVLAALEAARAAGAFTALIDCNGTTSSNVDCHVILPTGPEAIAGSTRLNAATVQKLALNSISTLAMVHLGRTYSNWMVFLQPKNAKLRDRQVRLLCTLTGASEDEVVDALGSSMRDGGVALAMLMRGWTDAEARAVISQDQLLRPLLEGTTADSVAVRAGRHGTPKPSPL